MTSVGPRPIDGSLSLGVLRLWIVFTENNKSKSVLSCCYESLHCSKILQLLPYLALCTAGGFIFNKNLQHYLARRSTMKSTTVKEQFLFVVTLLEGILKNYLWWRQNGDCQWQSLSPKSMSRNIKKILKAVRYRVQDKTNTISNVNGLQFSKPLPTKN